MSHVNNRHEFVLFFDVENGNPNGDPDAGNLPRIDPETSHGLVTDVCLKRKIRNYVAVAKGDADRFDIFVKEKGVLNREIEKAYVMDPDVKQLYEEWLAWEKASKQNKTNKKGEVKQGPSRPAKHYEDLARDWMCHNFFDIRTFGAVMTTGDKEREEEGEKSKLRKTAGQVRGPVQLNFARSVEPVTPAEHSITRMAVTNERDLEKERTMGRKHTVPYGLYRAEGYVSANLAQRTGFSEGDLELLWEALLNMFDHDHSAARGKMASRKLIVFKHGSALGDAPAHRLFDLVKCERATDKSLPARAFSDYKITVDAAAAPEGVEVIEKL